MSQKQKQMITVKPNVSEQNDNAHNFGKERSLDLKKQPAKTYASILLQ
jgi:hypothetical protein